MRNASILLIHHTSAKNQRRARGSTVLPGGVDFSWRIEQQNGVQSLILDKGRDLETTIPPMPYEMRQTVVSEIVNTEGEPIRTVVVVPLDQKSAEDQAREFEALKTALVDVLSDTPQTQKQLFVAVRGRGTPFRNDRAREALRQLINDGQAAITNRRYVRVNRPNSEPEGTA